jgi:hypothetical protein
VFVRRRNGSQAAAHYIKQQPVSSPPTYPEKRL